MAIIGGNNSIYPQVTEEGMFDSYPIGRTTTCGCESCYWTGSYAGCVGGTALLTNAQMFDMTGTAIGAVQTLTRVPMFQVCYVC